MFVAGIFTWFGFIIPFEEKLQMIKDSGFSTTCTWWGDEFLESEGDYRAHPEIADRIGLRVEHAHISYYVANKIWEDSLDGESIYQKYINDIKQARSSGLKTLVVHPFEKTAPNVSDDKICLERFKRLGDVAEKYDIELAVENLSDNQTLKNILNYADHPNIGLCFDSGHNFITCGNDFSLLTEFSDRIHALHLHDNDRTNDAHLLPYEGEIDWASFNNILKTTEYKKSIMLEASYPYEYDELNETIIFDQTISPQDYLHKAIIACKDVYNGKDI